MIISRERFLDDTSDYRLSLGLQTHAMAMHSALADAPQSVHAEVADILVDALDRIEAVLTPVVRARLRAPGTSSFGCGT